MAAVGIVLALAIPVLAAETSTPIKAETGRSVILDPTDGLDTVAGQGAVLSWSWAERPSTSVAEFSDPSVLRPSFTPDVAGSWVARLDLNDASDPATTIASTFVHVSTENVPPVARIAARGTSDGNASLTLDGTRSFDVDGERIAYAWDLVSAPDGNTAVNGRVRSIFTGLVRTIKLRQTIFRKLREIQ